MKTWIRVAAPLLLAASAAGAAPDDTVEIPVGDLTRPVGRGAAPVPHAISWPSPSGGGSFVLPTEEGVLTVRECPVDPQEVAGLLRQILGAGGEGVASIDDSLVVPKSAEAAVRAVLARIRSQRPGPVDLEYALEVSSSGGAWSPLVAGREPVLPGEARVFGDVRDRSYLGDFDVELAQASEIPDPVVQVQRTGTLVALRVLPLPGGSAAVVQLDGMTAEPLLLDPIMLPSHADMAPLDRAAVARDQVRTLFLVEPGKAAEQTWTGKDGRTVRLRLTARWTPAPADAGEGAVFWSPVFGAHLRSYRHVGYQMRPANSEADEEWPPFGRGDDVSLESPERVGARFPAGSVKWNNPTHGGLVVLTGKDAAAARDALVASLLREFRNARVEVVVREVPSAGGKGVGPERELFRASGIVSQRINACFLGTEARAFLQDADVEVAQASKIIDPVIGVLTIGSFCNVRAIPGADGAPAYLDLDVQLSKLEAMEEGLIPVVRTGVGDVLTGSVHGKSGWSDVTLQGPPKGPPPPKTNYRIEMPQCREMRVAGLYPVGPDGKVVLRRTAPGFLGEGKELVVEATVK